MKIHQEYVRSIMFGVEDSLVSTTGLIAGISIAAQSNKFVIMASVVAIAIEAVSMGVSEYLSDDAVQDLDKVKRFHDNSLLSGVFMMMSYAIAGLVPLLPMIFLPFPISLATAVVGALICLFLLGYIKGRILKTPATKGGIKILIVGGITTILGLILGFVFKV